MRRHRQSGIATCSQRLLDRQQRQVQPPMERPAQPKELAPAYVFLAAPSCASYISGMVLPVMGGPTS